MSVKYLKPYMQWGISEESWVRVGVSRKSSPTGFALGSRVWLGKSAVGRHRNHGYKAGEHVGPVTEEGGQGLLHHLAPSGASKG